MSATVSDYLLYRLSQWGVRRIYGYPGDGINGILGALGRTSEFHFVQTRHEEMSAFMACAHAKFTGQPGVCLATSGPGAIHLLNGLYDAKLDHQPVVAIVGQQSRAVLGGHYQQEVDLLSLFKDVASEYCTMVTNPSAVRHAVDRAVRVALYERTVTCIILPNDIQEEAYQKPERAHGTVHSSVGYSVPRVLPREPDLRRAADVLNAGKKVAMLVGAGAMNAAEEVVQVADLLGAGVAKALLGKAVLPDDLPFVTGSIGLLGTKASWDLMSECDTLLMVGTSFPYSEFLPKEGQARGVQIDLDGRMLAIRYPMEVALVGDSQETLRALIPLLQRKEDRSWRDTLEKSVRQWRKTAEALAMESANPLNPRRVFWELSPKLPDEVILTGDSGSGTSWFAQYLDIRKGMMASVSGNLATMGCAVPYAIGAKFAFPHRPVLAVAGDGAMQMNGNSELITVAKYWKGWKDPRFIVLVLNNRDLNMVTWEQRVLAGDPKLPATQDLPDFPYAKYAESLGLKGIRVDRPESLGRAWDEALSADRPVVFEAYVDPDVPLLPPHITFEQAKHYAQALAKGDVNAGGILKQSLKAMKDQLLPNKGGKE
ncbi:thiamine pyrophosphate-requiring protein [Pyxidicoccus xibeiensis]|uniref:thiamine pyrophosphate-requiring protein n=1 Tax=Pyxidicoccus xibeiensis TaxID=2906759 RepID=UPI0020A82439|nr:thiamine pyrophosphate-requiring protein [Pyxidicoccus xibeiensis]MCP3142395.1 thiamine pyrophosphate-requiring protein [Pyxidicoccus xibeiensis]